MDKEIIIPSVENTSIRIYDAQLSAKKETSCDWHFHNEIELFFLHEGTKIFHTKSRIVEIDKGDIVFVNGRIPHKTITPVGSQGTLIQFNDDYSPNDSAFDKYVLTILNKKSLELCVFRAGTSLNKQLCECAEKIRLEYSKKEKFCNMYIKAYVSEILACLYRYDILVLPDNPADNRSVSDILPVLDYINKHYFEHISLEDMSSLIHTEKSYFCKIFKKATHTTFLNYLNLIRIYHAETLLRETRKSITEIALETGFTSPSYFAETFKKINLLSPVAYRKMIVSANL